MPPPLTARLQPLPWPTPACRPRPPAPAPYLPTSCYVPPPSRALAILTAGLHPLGVALMRRRPPAAMQPAAGARAPARGVQRPVARQLVLLDELQHAAKALTTVCAVRAVALGLVSGRGCARPRWDLVAGGRSVGGDAEVAGAALAGGVEAGGGAGMGVGVGVGVGGRVGVHGVSVVGIVRVVVGVGGDVGVLVGAGAVGVHVGGGRGEVAGGDGEGRGAREGRGVRL